MTEKESKTAMERIEEMLGEARRIMEEARSEAKELKRKAREEWRRERHGRRRHHDERKKEKVLNLRIESDLEEKIKMEAERLSVPVSTLVRNILDNTFKLVDGVTENVGNLVDDVVENAGMIGKRFRSAVRDCMEEPAGDKAPEKAEGPKDETQEPARPSIDDVLMWREVTLGKPAACAACDVSIARGHKAHAGEHEKTKSTLILCDNCLDKLKIQQA